VLARLRDFVGFSRLPHSDARLVHADNTAQILDDFAARLSRLETRVAYVERCLGEPSGLAAESGALEALLDCRLSQVEARLAVVFEARLAQAVSAAPVADVRT